MVLPKQRLTHTESKNYNPLNGMDVEWDKCPQCGIFYVPSTRKICSICEGRNADNAKGLPVCMKCYVRHLQPGENQCVCEKLNL